MKSCEFVVTDVGDGLCSGISLSPYPSYHLARRLYRPPPYCSLVSLVDWGSGGSYSSALRAYDYLVNYRGFHKDCDCNFIDSFLLSHFHSDHYKGLLAAAAYAPTQPHYYDQWRNLQRVYGPGIPETPNRKELVVALMAMNAYTLGNRSGSMHIDFLRAIARLNKYGNGFKYQTLYQGATFKMAGQHYHCVWPPKTLGEAETTKGIEGALSKYKNALESDLKLKDIDQKIRDDSLVGALLEDSRKIESDGRSDREHDLRDYFYKEETRELPKVVQEANKALRRVANNLCLVFYNGSSLLFLGDIGDKQIPHVVEYLKSVGLLEFKTILAAHHGTHWHKSLNHLRTENLVISAGKERTKTYKKSYSSIAERVLSTHLNGHISVPLNKII